MRVRIHLNLAEPTRAESALKIQSEKGGWVTVAYATGIVVDHAVPVVDHALRERVRRGEIKKVPHAFIEGDLVSFQGRWRPKAPVSLKDQLAAHHKAGPSNPAQISSRQVGYNPRVATCFYAVAPNHDMARLSERFVQADRLEAVGWGFFVQGGVFSPLTLEDRCDPQDLDRTSAFEKVALGQGWATTLKLMQDSVPASELRRRPRLR